MKGVVIPGTQLKVDSDELDPDNSFEHFLSCVHLESDYNFEAMKDHGIITSSFNKWFLVKFHAFDPRKILCLNETETAKIQEKETNVITEVKIIDSNHCAGSVMFLFEGTTGNYLYTGNFRFYENLLDAPPLQKYRYHADRLTTLYMHSPWSLDIYPVFPRKPLLLSHIISVAKRYSDQYIILVSPHVGNEELYVGLALELQRRIYINFERLKTLKHLNLDKYFTDNIEESSIWVVSSNELRKVDLDCLDAPYQIFSLSSDQNLDFLKQNINHYFPYNSHSSRDEVAFFIKSFEPFRLHIIYCSTSTESLQGCLNRDPEPFKENLQCKNVQHTFNRGKDKLGGARMENKNNQMAQESTEYLENVAGKRAKVSKDLKAPKKHNAHIEVNRRHSAHHESVINDLSSWGDISPINPIKPTSPPAKTMLMRHIDRLKGAGAKRKKKCRCKVLRHTGDKKSRRIECQKCESEKGAEQTGDGCKRTGSESSASGSMAFWSDLEGVDITMPARHIVDKF